MEKTNQPKQAANKGFITLPRHAYNQLCRKYGKHPASETEAYCILTANVNYHEQRVTLYGKPVVCQRGCSVRSLESWAKLFRWSKSRVRRFFLVLHQLQLAEYSTDDSLTHIRLTDFLPQSRNPANNRRDEEFERFWEAYHAATQLPKRSIGKARREWKMLTPEERHKAIEQIPYYYDGLDSTRYCKHAAGYLADKCFLDE